MFMVVQEGKKTKDLLAGDDDDDADDVGAEQAMDRNRCKRVQHEQAYSFLGVGYT